MMQLEFIPVPTRLVEFDSGITLTVAEHVSLGKQLKRVLEFMLDGSWHSVAEVSDKLGIQPTSADAQIRNLRKKKHGRFTVEYQRVNGRAFYQLQLNGGMENALHNSNGLA